MWLVLQMRLVSKEPPGYAKEKAEGKLLGIPSSAGVGVSRDGLGFPELEVRREHLDCARRDM